MAINPKDDYESLAKLLYPSIEASGNVYYGQTRKLTMDEVFDKNNGGFHSHIESQYNDVSKEYDTFFCWELGPLKGAIKTRDALLLLDQPLFCAKYRLVIENSEDDEELHSGNFKTYKRNVTAVFDSIVKVDDDGVPVIDDANFYVDNNGVNHFIYIALKNCDSQSDIDEDDDNYFYEAPSFKSNNELRFEFVPDENNQLNLSITLNALGGMPTDIYQYKKNDGDWQTFTASTLNTTGTIISCTNINDVVKFRFNSETYGTSKPAQTSSKYIHFNISGDGYVNIKGDIRSLQKTTNENFVSNYEFSSLFMANSNILNVDRNVLPSSGLGEYAYANMFTQCTSLRSVPDLPAGNGYYGVGRDAYTYMFSNCTSLIKAQKILRRRSTVETGTYSSMFYCCSSLTESPYISFSSAGFAAFLNMFNGCTSLKIANDINGYSLDQYACQGMFSGCKSLTKAPKMPTRGNAHCLQETFKGCTSLKQALVLSSKYYCPYERIFKDCSNLRVIFCFYENETYNFNAADMLHNVAPNGVFYCNKTYYLAHQNDFASIVPSSWEIRDLYENVYSYDDTCDLIVDHSNKEIITSGTDSIYNGRGKLSDESTLLNMEKSFNVSQMNAYNPDGSYNQEVWGYKSFNSPIAFRNGIYTDGCSLISTGSSLIDTSNETLATFAVNDLCSSGEDRPDGSKANARVRLFSTPVFDWDGDDVAIDEVSLISGDRDTAKDIEWVHHSDEYDGNGTVIRSSYLRSADLVYSRSVIDNSCDDSEYKGRSYLSMEASNDGMASAVICTHNTDHEDNTYMSSKIEMYGSNVYLQAAYSDDNNDNLASLGISSNSTQSEAYITADDIYLNGTVHGTISGSIDHADHAANSDHATNLSCSSESTSTAKLTAENDKVSVKTDLMPDTDITYKLGQSNNRWNHVYAKNLGDTACRIENSYLSAVDADTLTVSGASALNSSVTIGGSIAIGGELSLSANQSHDLGFYTPEHNIYSDQSIKLYVDRLISFTGNSDLPSDSILNDVAIDCFQYGSRNYGELLEGMYDNYNACLSFSGSYTTGSSEDRRLFACSHLGGQYVFGFGRNTGADKLLCGFVDIWNPLHRTPSEYWYCPKPCYIGITSEGNIKFIAGKYYTTYTPTLNDTIFTTISFIRYSKEYDTHGFSPIEYTDSYDITTSILVRQLQYFNTFMFLVPHDNDFAFYIGKIDRSSNITNIQIAVEYKYDTAEDTSGLFTGEDLSRIMSSINVDKNLFYSPAGGGYNLSALYIINAIEDVVIHRTIGDSYGSYLEFKITDMELNKHSKYNSENELANHLYGFDYNEFMYLVSSYNPSAHVTRTSLCFKNGWYVESKGMAIRPIKKYMPSISLCRYQL